MIAASCNEGALCWMDQHDYIAAWMQGVGTFVALLAILVTLEHFRREGFRPRINLTKDAHNQRVLLTIDNLGRTEGRVDQIHVGTLSASRWQLRRWSSFDIDDSVRPRFAAVDRPAAGDILPLPIPGATSAQLMLEATTTTTVFDNPAAWVIVIAGGHTKRAKVGKAKCRALNEDLYGSATPPDKGAAMVVRRIARYDLLDGVPAERFDQLTAEMVAQIATHEPGTLIYVTHRVNAEPLSRLFYEVYADEAAFQVHEQAQHVIDFHARKQPLLAGDPRVQFLTSGPGKGLQS
jgi:quinol monooxygenase YgiN